MKARIPKKSKLRLSKTDYAYVVADVIPQHSAMCIAALEEEFGFGEQRIKRFMLRYNQLVERCEILLPNGRHLKPTDYLAYYQEKYGIDLTCKKITVRGENEK